MLAVLEDMTHHGNPVSFTAVAKSAGVSHWLVYADGIRERIETARAQQNHKPRRDQRTGLSPSAASLATDLRLARAEQQAPHRTRPAQGRPPAATRGPARPALPQSLVRARRRANSAQPAAQRRNERLQQDNEALRERLAETEDDLAGTRTALRRVMHQTNLTDPAG